MYIGYKQRKIQTDRQTKGMYHMALIIAWSEPVLYLKDIVSLFISEYLKISEKLNPASKKYSLY